MALDKIVYGLYLPDYAVAHTITFQVLTMAREDFGAGIKRMTRFGHLIPDAWTAPRLADWLQRLRCWKRPEGRWETREQAHVSPSRSRSSGVASFFFFSCLAPEVNENPAEMVWPSAFGQET